MGYGPVTKNKFGWSWRNEHGNGTRMSPYFKTEKIAMKFHDYFRDNIEKYNYMLQQNPMVSRLFIRNLADLRLFKIQDVIKIADDFVNENELQDVIKIPKKETLYQFYGCEMENHCGYYEEI